MFFSSYSPFTLLIFKYLNVKLNHNLYKSNNDANDMIGKTKDSISNIIFLAVDWSGLEQPALTIAIKGNGIMNIQKPPIIITTPVAIEKSNPIRRPVTDDRPNE